MLDNKTKKIIIRDAYNAHPMTLYFNSVGIKNPVSSKTAFSKNQYEVLNKSSKHYHFKIHRGKCTQFYSLDKTNDIGVNIVHMEFLLGRGFSETDFKKIFNQALNFNKTIKRNQFFVFHKSNFRKYLEKRGCYNKGTLLAAKVSDGMNYLSQYEFSPELEIRQLKKSEIPLAVKLEVRAHRNSLTSRVEIVSIKGLTKFYEWGFKEKFPCYAVFENKKLIGVTVPCVNKFGLGGIMTVAVDPQEQGRGVSKILYLQALKYWKSKKVKVYFGVTTTDEVLGLAKKLKRKAIGYYLEYKRN